MFNGREAPTRRNFAARALAHDHPKPERREERIEQTLREYQTRTPMTGATGLRTLRGVTRTPRYRASLGFVRSAG
jgi:hypothetical protein